MDQNRASRSRARVLVVQRRAVPGELKEGDGSRLLVRLLYHGMQD